jgi:hypothetical protein
MNRNLTVAGVAMLALSGCAMLQNLTVSDIKQPEYLRESRVFDKTIPQIRDAMAAYALKCRPGSPLISDPADSTKAYVIASMPGRSEASVIMVVAFSQNGGQTSADGYSYFSTWKGHIENVFNVIDRPDVCL